jgi:hypothetical protein
LIPLKWRIAQVGKLSILKNEWQVDFVTTCLLFI